MPKNLAREIVRALKPVLKPICALGDGLWMPGGNTMTWDAEQWAEGIIAAKLAEANTARDERVAEAIEEIELGRSLIFHDPDAAEGCFVKALALLGGGE